MKALLPTLLATLMLSFSPAPAQAAAGANWGFVSPLPPGKLVRGYGHRVANRAHRAMPHTGLDYAAAKGSLVRAAGRGTVRSYGTVPGFGKVLVLDHGMGLTSSYAHLDKAEVAVGAWVDAGQAIARVGNSGVPSGRAQLHFELRQDGKVINPRPLLRF